jgi:hypothetical protein
MVGVKLGASIANNAGIRTTVVGIAVSDAGQKMQLEGQMEIGSRYLHLS